MNRQASSLIVLLLVALFLAFAALVLQPAKPDMLAHVTMLNVGQGDSFLIQITNGKKLLIDGGRDATVLSELSKILPVGDRTIDVVIATHPDTDHIGGLPFVLSRYRVGLFLTPEVLTDTKTFTALYDKLSEHHVPSYYARHGMMLELDNLSGDPPSNFAILFPDRATTNWETNHASLVGRLQVGKRSALFTGDSPISIEHFLDIADPQDLDVDILKLGHHGSKTSSSEEYLRATSPVLALISAGVGNSYGHPHQEVMSRLQALGIRTISTQDQGTVTLSTDGQKWRIEE